jgi:hypothetical protein
METGRDLGREVDRRIDVDRLERDRLIATSGAAKYASCPKSRSGSSLRFHLTMSMSFGIYPNLTALAIYRGIREKSMVMGRQSQKYAEVKRKWSLPKAPVANQPGETME